MATEDLEYLEQRAEEEIEMARRATSTEAVQAHYELATAYLDRIHGDEPKSDRNPFNEV